jgi:hypothetical protein
VESIYPDPGLTDPRLRFHMGKVANHEPFISPIDPDMPFPVSEWTLQQWHEDSYMSGDQMTKNDPATSDALLGIAPYAFAAPDAHSHLWIYHGAKPGTWVYEVYERDGTMRPEGGANIFMATTQPAKLTTFDHEIEYSVDLKLKEAEIHYLTPTAKQSGAVLGQIFTGFGIHFFNPTTKQKQFVFLQIPIANSRENTHKDYYVVLPTDGAGLSLLYSAGMDSGEPTFRFAPDGGQLHSFHYSLNRYVAQMVARPYSWNGRTVEWPAEAHDYRNWSLGGMYLGLETQSTDERPESTNHDQQGSVQMTLQIANLSVTQDGDRPGPHP